MTLPEETKAATRASPSRRRLGQLPWWAFCSPSTRVIWKLLYSPDSFVSLGIERRPVNGSADAPPPAGYRDAGPRGRRRAARLPRQDPAMARRQLHPQRNHVVAEAQAGRRARQRVGERPRRAEQATVERRHA
jgi:hypothetical protein